MTTSTVGTRTDREIQQDVLQELRWDSRVKETDIGVEVDRGVVTLTGTVDCWAKKLAAKEAGHRVRGVLDVADDVEVRFPGSLRLTDTEIAQSARQALRWNAFVPDEKIRMTVSDGEVMLEGEMETLRQKDDAERTLRALTCVKSVQNLLTVARSEANPRQLRESIEKALERRAEKEAQQIRVKVENGVVALDGRVRTWAEKQAVLGAVSHAPGVQDVRDHLTVSPWD